MEEKSKKGDYFYIDCVKLIMSIFVVAAHTNPLYGCTNKFINTVMQVLISCAVPFFFICTGYFLNEKFSLELNSKQNVNIVKRCLIKTIKLYVTWTIIYLPITIYAYRVGGKDWFII